MLIYIVYKNLKRQHSKAKQLQN